MDQNGSGKTRQAAPGIRSTVSFIIFLENVLGQGATSKVYLGRNKKTGKRVACKVPHGPGLLRLGVDLDRESEVLLKIRHPNIVCLEAIEKDQISKESIMMMELCSGGSLYDRLERPENAHGLQEQVFLDVLRDMTCGMKYLRENGYVHRDVKPGNIMCYKDNNGKTIYKLADFGAARALTDDENFTSLHGTEEYLHPNVFERAVLRRPVAAPFDAKVDLWSIGASLYHLATGSLPFRPQGGRRNATMMFHLTTKKPPGVISGVQTGSGEHEIIWDTQLPETCQLSMGLKRLLTPLLAGLLEHNSDKMWSFNKFFEVSQSITNKLALDVFWVCESSNFKIYLNPRDTFSKFQEQVDSQTKISGGKQSFLLHGLPFQPESTSTIAEFPVITENNPIILCNKTEINRQCTIYPPLVAIMPTLPPRFSTQNDFPVAKEALTVCHILQRRQDRLHLMHQLFDDFVQAFCASLSSDHLKHKVHLGEVNTIFSLVTREAAEGMRLLSLWNRLQPAEKKQKGGPSRDSVHTFINQLKQQLGVYSDQIKQCEQQLSIVASTLQKLEHDLHGKDGTCSSWKASQGCNLVNNICTTEIFHLTSQMEEIFKRFSRDKKMGKLSYNDEQIHKMEKLNLSDLIKMTKTCMKKCEGRWKDRHSHLMVWYKQSQNNQFLITKVDSILKPLADKCVELRTNISALTSKCWQMIESQADPSPSGIQLPTAATMALLLSASTQTSLPGDGLSYPLTIGLDHPSSQLYSTTASGQPLEMGGPWLAPAPSLPFPPRRGHIVTSSKRYGGASASPTALSAPPCDQGHYDDVKDIHTSHMHAFRSSPELTARGLPHLTPDSPYLTKKPDHSPDFNQASPRSRMIRISKQQKQEIEDYKKNSNSIPQLLKESSEVINDLEIAGLSLGDVEVPANVHDDTLFLPTLVPEGTDFDDKDGDEDRTFSDDIKFDIKRPPSSYWTVDK